MAKIHDPGRESVSEKVRIEKIDPRPIQTALFDAVSEAVSEAVIEIDDGGLVVSMNLSAQDLTGWQLGEAKGRPIGDVVVLIKIAKVTFYAFCQNIRFIQRYLPRDKP